MPMRVTSPMIEEANRHNDLSRWYRDKALGQRLTVQLTEALNESLEQVFGYHMLVAGTDMGLELSRLGKTQRLFRLVTRANADQPLQAIVGSSRELPFATDSLDALVLCHSLDSSSVPHQTLRECQRVLVPNGHLFVISFNPFSVRGVMKGLRGWLSRGRRHPKSISGRRLGDWLSLLGFSHAEPHYFASFVPLGKGRVGRFMRIDLTAGWRGSMPRRGRSIYCTRASGWRTSIRASRSRTLGLSRYHLVKHRRVCRCPSR